MSGGNLGVYHVRRKFKQCISLLNHGCYRSNHGINIYIYIYIRTTSRSHYTARLHAGVKTKVLVFFLTGMFALLWDMLKERVALKLCYGYSTVL